MCGMVGDDVVKTLTELFDFVRGKVPVRGLSGPPELAMSHLLERHDFAETWRVRLGHRRGATRGTNGESRHADDSSCHNQSPWLSLLTAILSWQSNAGS